MMRRILNFKIIQGFERYFLPKVENKLLKNNQVSKWNFQQLKTCSTVATKSMDTLYTSDDPKKEKLLKVLQVKVKFELTFGKTQNKTKVKNSR